MQLTDGKAVVVAVTLLAGVALAACGAHSSDPDGGRTSDPGPQPPATASASPTLGAEDQVSLQISAKVAPEPAFGTGSPPVNHVYDVGPGLLIDYRVENARSTPVLVADGMPNGATRMTLDDVPDPLRTFVRPDGDDGLQLSKRTFPEESEGDFPSSFQARVIEPGAGITGRAFVPFPVADFNASNPLPQNPTTWRFCLGVFTSYAGLATSDDGTTALVANTPYAGDRAQRLLCSEPQPLPDGWDRG